MADVEGLDPAVLVERQPTKNPSSTSSSVLNLACSRSQSVSSAIAEAQMMPLVQISAAFSGSLKR